MRNTEFIISRTHTPHCTQAFTETTQRFNEHTKTRVAVSSIGRMPGRLPLEEEGRGEAAWRRTTWRQPRCHIGRASPEARRTGGCVAAEPRRRRWRRRRPEASMASGGIVGTEMAGTLAARGRAQSATRRWLGRHAPERLAPSASASCAGFGTSFGSAPSRRRRKSGGGKRLLEKVQSLK